MAKSTIEPPTPEEYTILWMLSNLSMFEPASQYGDATPNSAIIHMTSLSMTRSLFAKVFPPTTPVQYIIAWAPTINAERCLSETSASCVFFFGPTDTLCPMKPATTTQKAAWKCIPGLTNQGAIESLNNPASSTTSPSGAHSTHGNRAINIASDPSTPATLNIPASDTTNKAKPNP